MTAKIGMPPIDRKDNTEDIVESFAIGVVVPGAGRALSIKKPEKNLLDEEGKRWCQSVVGTIVNLAEVSQYGIFYDVNQLAR